MNQPKVRTHNTLWRCVVCEKWHGAEQQMIVVSAIVQLSEQQHGLSVARAMVAVDEACFKELNLSDSLPAIHLPTTSDVSKLHLGKFS